MKVCLQNPACKWWVLTIISELVLIASFLMFIILSVKQFWLKHETCLLLLKGESASLIKITEKKDHFVQK